MMFGLRERFVYLECDECGCLALANVPEDLGPYYPSNYYSFSGAQVTAEPAVIAALRRSRSELILRLPVWMVQCLVDRNRVPELFLWTAGLGLSTRARVCDVGCGDGQRLVAMFRQGFRLLTGYDPYLDEDRLVGGRIPLVRGGVKDIGSGWDLITLHHVFEHMPDPRGALSELSSRLAPGGALVIRTPVADSWAWRNYGADWVQLDPPRHLFVHTSRSIEILAGACGLVLERDFRDSYSFQFWGSELYRRDIQLRDGDGHPLDRAGTVFSHEQLADFRRRSVELNRRGEGDSAGFVLRRPGS
jgi:SAM-dependent methyltransferase